MFNPAVVQGPGLGIIRRGPSERQGGDFPPSNGSVRRSLPMTSTTTNPVSIKPTAVLQGAGSADDRPSTAANSSLLFTDNSLVVDVTEEIVPPTRFATGLKFSSNCRHVFDSSHEAMLLALREAHATRLTIDNKIAQLTDMRHGLAHEMDELAKKVRETMTLCDCAAGIGSPTGEAIRQIAVAANPSAVVRGSASTRVPFVLPDLQDVLPDHQQQQQQQRSTPMRLTYGRHVGERTSPDPAAPPAPLLRAPTPHQQHHGAGNIVEQTPPAGSHPAGFDRDADLLQHLLQAQLRKREEELRRRMIRNSSQRPT